MTNRISFIDRFSVITEREAQKSYEIISLVLTLIASLIEWVAQLHFITSSYSFMFLSRIDFGL